MPISPVVMPMTPDEQLLYDTLTDPATPYCGSYWDIAARAGKDHHWVNNTISSVRRKATDGRLDWTVPPVPTGPGPHMILAVDLGGGTPMTLDEQEAVKEGSAVQSAKLTSQINNMVTEMRATALRCPPKQARRFRRAAAVLETGGLMTEDAYDVMDRIVLNGGTP